MSMLSTEERSELRHYLETRFNLSELRTLTFDMGLSYELFPHETLPEFTREFIQFCERRHLESCLLKEISRQRTDTENWLKTLIAKLPPCHKGAKIQVVVDKTILERVQDLLGELAQELGISDEEIVIVGAAWGSTYLLLSIPTSAMNSTRFKQITSLGNGRYRILSIEAYIYLSSQSQETWKRIAISHPPLMNNGLLLSTISWQEAQRSENKKKEEMPVSPNISPSTHWLSRTENQTHLLAISRELVGELAPGESDSLESLFPRYAQMAQLGQVKTVKQAQTAFGLTGDVASLSIVILSVLFTAVNVWVGKQNRETLSELKLQQEADRVMLDRLVEDGMKQNRIPKHKREQLRPLMSEAIAKEIGDPYSPYERGLDNIAERIRMDIELLTYEQQLRENIAHARRYGDTPEGASRRSQIIEQLNRLSLQRLGQSFNDLCRMFIDGAI